MNIDFSEEVQVGLSQLSPEDVQEYVENAVYGQLKRDRYVESDDGWEVRSEDLIYPPSLTNPQYRVVYTVDTSGGGAGFSFSGGGGGYFGPGGGSPDNLPSVGIGGNGKAAIPESPLDSATFQILRSLINQTKQTLGEAIDELERRKEMADADVSDLDIAAGMYGEYLFKQRKEA